MYNLFTNVSKVRSVSFALPAYEYLRKAFLYDIDRLIDFKRSFPKAVRSDHLLIKTLQSINVVFNGDLEIYRSIVESRTNQISGGLGYCSDFYKGRPFYGSKAQFYGNKTVEIIIATDEDFSLRDAQLTWKTWRPVRVLAHPRSDFTIETIDGTNTFSESGVCVIEVNIPMLACQYQMWLAEQRKEQVAIPRTIGHFLSMYPLTNAVYSHLDVSLLNRFSRRLLGEPVGNADDYVPFYIQDYSKRIDDLIESVNREFVRRPMPWEDVLRNIPSIIDGNMLEVIRLPKIARNHQSIWALLAARLFVTTYLLALRKKGKDFKNLDDIILIKRALVNVETGKLISNGIPKALAEWLQKYIDNRIIHYF